MDRRTFLRRATVVGAVGLAGCAGDDGGATDSPTGDDAGANTTAEGDGTTAQPDTATESMGDETTTGTGETTMESTATESMETEAAESTTESTTTAPTTQTASEPQESVTVTVGADGKARFGPESFTLAQGGTVTWEWTQAGHNVIPDSQPSGAGFEGTPGGGSKLYDAGYTHEETFDTTGEYEYYCSAHESFGMVGSFTVE